MTEDLDLQAVAKVGLQGTEQAVELALAAWSEGSIQDAVSEAMLEGRLITTDIRNAAEYIFDNLPQTIINSLALELKDQWMDELEEIDFHAQSWVDYVDEAENQDGWQYWLQFSSSKEVARDYQLYLDETEE